MRSELVRLVLLYFSSEACCLCQGERFYSVFGSCYILNNLAWFAISRIWYHFM